MSDSLPIVEHAMAGGAEDDADWEEWDGRSPFWIHCVAGSLAGVTEVSAIHGDFYSTMKRESFPRR